MYPQAWEKVNCHEKGRIVHSGSGPVATASADPDAAHLPHGQGSQFIIATHSPILLGLPGAQILNFSEEGIQPIPYSDINVRDTSLREALKSPLSWHCGTADC